MKKQNVVIVDDQVLLAQALATMVNSFENFHVVGLAKHGKDLIEQLENHHVKPDLILMDVNMPFINGIDATTWLTENRPKIKVLALSVEHEDSTIIKMLKAGAKGYILKDSEKDILKLAMTQIIEIGFYHSNQITRLFLDSIGERKSFNQGLKENEIEFMKLVCSGDTYKEIADKMHLSPKTIDGYRDNLFSKLQLKNRTELVIYAIKHKYFTP